MTNTSSGSKSRRIKLDVVIREPITVERLLVWTYRDQKADLMSGKGLHGLEAGADGYEGGTFSGSASCVATIEMNGLLGNVIRSTAYQQRPALHPDAERVNDVVLSLPWATAGLLISHARTGSQPEWGAEQVLEPIIQGGGYVREEIAETVEVKYAKDRRMVQVPFCPVALYPSDESLATMRAVYGCWHGGLAMLHDLLTDGPELTRWKVEGIGAPATPWRAG